MFLLKVGGWGLASTHTGVVKERSRGSPVARNTKGTLRFGFNDEGERVQLGDLVVQVAPIRT